MWSHYLALPASVPCAAATLETLRRAKQRVLPFLCAFSDLLPSSTVILLKVSTKTHCHSPEPSLPCLSSPSSLHPPSLPPPSILLSFIVVFVQESRKSAYPTHGDVCQSHTKFKLLGKAQHYLHHQQQTCVCVCTVNNTCSYFGEVVSLPLVNRDRFFFLEGTHLQMGTRWCSISTFYWRANLLIDSLVRFISFGNPAQSSVLHKVLLSHLTCFFIFYKVETRNKLNRLWEPAWNTESVQSVFYEAILMWRKKESNFQNSLGCIFVYYTFCSTYQQWKGQEGWKVEESGTLKRKATIGEQQQNLTPSFLK